MNVVILQGRPTQDPELKDTASGRIMCKIRLAVDRPYLGKNAPKRTDYFDVICFGQLGQSMHRNLAKGALCTILGRLEQSEFMDRSGQKRENYTVVANKITIHEWLKRKSNLEELGIDTDLLSPRESTATLGMKAVDFEDIDMPSNYYEWE